jgi:SMI1-KNR4 cell-wall
MWRERIKTLSATAKFSSCAAITTISSAEDALGIRLPTELVEILSESDGVIGEYGLGLLWPVSRIQKDNLIFRNSVDFRTLYMPFDSLLFFGDAGNGDQFAFSILQGEIRRTDIFVWAHENDSRTWVAPSLRLYFDWWLTGKITL